MEMQPDGTISHTHETSGKSGDDGQEKYKYDVEIEAQFKVL